MNKEMDSSNDYNLDINMLAHDRLGACSRSLYREIQNGTLIADKVGRSWKTNEENWSAFLESKFSK